MAVNFEIKTTRISLGGDGYFDVRGISADDLTHLTLGHLDEMKAAVAQYGKTGIPAERVAEMLLTLAREFGSLTSEIISRAADAPDRVDDFRRLPFPTTVKALKAIFDLSMTDGGVELGNLGRVLVALAETNGLRLGPLGTQLNDIISNAESMSAT